jgi:hypothetical protein
MDGRPAAVVVTAVVARAGVVVAQPEVPDEPEYEQADVEDSEADHEDPAVRAHPLIVPRKARSSPCSKACSEASVAASSSIDPIT